MPDRDNEPNYSRIPAGRYKCRIRISPRFGKVYHITDVKGRTYILTHSGNFAGDIRKKLKTHTAGCILLGKKTGTLAGQEAVLCSRPALRGFMEYMNDEDFMLDVKEAV